MNVLHTQGVLGSQARRRRERITAMCSKHPLVCLETTVLGCNLLVSANLSWIMQEGGVGSLWKGRDPVIRTRHPSCRTPLSPELFLESLF